MVSLHLVFLCIVVDAAPLSVHSGCEAGSCVQTWPRGSDEVCLSFLQRQQLRSRFSDLEGNAAASFVQDLDHPQHGASATVAPEWTPEAMRKAEKCALELVGTHHEKSISDQAITSPHRNGRDGNQNIRKDGKDLGPGKDRSWGPSDSRIDGGPGCWLSPTNNLSQWIQWDFGTLKTVKQIKTLGRPFMGKQLVDEWVTEYWLEYAQETGKADNETTWIWLGNFTGNEEHNVPRIHDFSPPLEATKIKLHPTKWINRIAMRVEFYGCNKTDETIPAPGSPPAPGIMVCSDCEHCEATLEGAKTEKAVAGCPACAFGILKTWPCNVRGICRCAANETRQKDVEKDFCPECDVEKAYKARLKCPCQASAQRCPCPPPSPAVRPPAPAPTPRWVPAVPGQIIEASLQQRGVLGAKRATRRQNRTSSRQARKRVAHDKP